jgi:hypothetical protein
MYFDVERTIAEVRRVLRPGGVLVTTHFSWLPRVDRSPKASEALVLRLNPAWQGADWSGRIATEPAWAAVGRASRRCSGSTPTCRSRARAGAADASLPRRRRVAARGGCHRFDSALDAWLEATTGADVHRSPSRRRAPVHAVARRHDVRGARARVERFFAPHRLIDWHSRRLPP